MIVVNANQVLFENGLTALELYDHPNYAIDEYTITKVIIVDTHRTVLERRWNTGDTDTIYLYGTANKQFWEIYTTNAL